MDIWVAQLGSKGMYIMWDNKEQAIFVANQEEKQHRRIIQLMERGRKVFLEKRSKEWQWRHSSVCERERRQWEG